MSRWMNVGEILRTNAALLPDKLGAKDLKRSMTFREWNDRSCRLANALLGLGLQKGDRFAVIAYNCVEWMEMYAAAAKAGLVVVPLMFRLAPLEYAYILQDSGAKAFIVGNPFLPGVDSIRGDLPELRHFIHLGDQPAPSGYLDYETLINQNSSDEPKVKVHHEDIWTFMYTSGTTGKPKGVVRTHESYTAFYILNVAEMGYGRDDIGLLVMPMCHVNSIFYSFSFTYCQAAVCVYNMVSFDPAHLLKTLAEEKITFTSLVPTHYIMILALPDSIKDQYDVSCVRKLLCSSAPARKDTKLGILKFFCNSELFEAYGSTEAGLVTLLRPQDQLKKLGSIGREIIGTGKIRLLDGMGNEVPQGEVGELYSRGPAFFREYWNLPEVTQAAFRDEYFSAGDMARQDEEGYYYLVDRKKNMIITGGENVYPSEVENVVGSHPAVKDVAVIGVPDDKWGELVKAVVILHEEYAGGPELAKEIIDYCRDKIAGYKKPKSIDFIEDDEMPRTGTGKILHRALRERYGKWSDQQQEELMLKNTFIPYKGYWSSPFCRWQGTFQNENAIVLGAETAKRFFRIRNISPDAFDGLYLGMTVGQPAWFYAAPWFAALMGNDTISGPTVSQACATSATVLGMAAMAVESGMYKNILVAATDRCSNGPHTVWPNPNGPGGQAISENWMMDNFGRDPYAGQAMIQTAENVAKEYGITKEESDAMAVRRYEQYLQAMADDRAFQKRYMIPVDIRVSKKQTVTVELDEGITPCTAEGLVKLAPVIQGGVISFGAQTHPADGNAGLIVASKEMAEALSTDKNISIQILSYGYARAEKAHMAKAVTPSAFMALENASLKVSDMAAVKTHNPFTVNDVVMGRLMGIDDKIFNNFGSSLIFGHPQGPTGARLIVELIEELVIKGGGYGLFAGCAAGDTAASVVIKVS